MVKRQETAKAFIVDEKDGSMKRCKCTINVTYIYTSLSRLVSLRPFLSFPSDSCDHSLTFYDKHLVQYREYGSAQRFSNMNAQIRL